MAPLDQVTGLRIELWDAGFRPVAVYNHDHAIEGAGKRPLGEDWANNARQNPPFCAVAKAVAHALNTGILCDGLRGLDVDIDDPGRAAAVRALAFEYFGPTIQRYRDDSARILLLYRAASGEPPKRSITSRSGLGKIEVLGRGQHFVAFGQHPDTGALLRWIPDPPNQVQIGDLTIVTEEQVERFLAAAAKLIDAEPPAAPSTAPHAPNSRLGADALQLIGALAGISNDGPADWEYWNKIGMATWAATGGSEAGRAMFHAWSAANHAYDPKATHARWDHYTTSPPSRIGAGTLFHEARAARARLRLNDAGPSLPPPPPPEDAGYWKSLEEQAALTPADWRALALRESGRAIPASKEARAEAGPELLWEIAEPWVEADIPRRPWVVRGYLLRGSVSVLSGPGSAGKSSLTNAWCVALASGTALANFRPPHAMRGMTYNTEDDAHEQQRRFSGAFSVMRVDPAQAMRNLVILGPREVGTLLALSPDGGILLNTPVLDRLCEAVERFRPDVLFLDPLVELHGADENDNTAVRAVMARLRALAVAFDMAVCVLHHARKGASTPGDPDSLRGASAIVGAARVVLTLNVMTEQDAERFGVAPEQRRQHFRLDGAKSNYAAVEQAEWFERVPLLLANQDSVAAIRPWKPPSVWAQHTPAELNRVLDLIAEGPRPGVLYTAKQPGSGPRWAGHLLVRELGVNERQAAQMVQTWLSNGLLVEESYADPEQRRARRGVRVNDSRRPS